MFRKLRVAATLTATCLPLAAAAGAAVPHDFLERYAATYRFRLGKPASIRPAPDGRTVLFLRSGPRSFERDLYELDLKTGRERVLLTAQSILGGATEELTAEEKARRERMRLAARGITSFHLSRDGKRLLVPLSGRLYVVDRESGEARELPVGREGGAPLDPQLSPDGRQVAFVRDGELHTIEVGGGAPLRLTHGAGDGVTHGLAEFVAQEEMSRRHGFWWSPDSSRILYQRTDTSGLEIMNIMDATRPEKPPDTWPYPRPGRRNAHVRLGLVPAAGGETTWIEWDRESHEYLTVVQWDEDAPLSLVVQNRRQTEQRLLSVDEASGTTSTLLVQRDAAWLEIDQSVPHWIGDRGFLWTSERGGESHVEFRGADGSLVHRVTPAGFGLQGFVAWLPQREQVLVRASHDPTETHLFLLPLDPTRGAPQRLTHEPGVHTATAGAEGKLWVHHASTLDGERWEVVRPGGRRGPALRSVAEDPGFDPRVEFTTVGGERRMHAAIVRPHDFDPARKYPVIDHVYGGPTSQMVRKTPARYLLDQWIADHGYVVVSIDGRGTPNRGRDWWRAVQGDLSSVALDDQAAGLRSLGARYSEMDLSRVGIYGWSFGGYMAAMAVMREPGLFRAGVAGAPVVDWADYDTHYTERYMGLPADNPAGYRTANVLTHAESLERPLLLIHGTGDDNVYFMHSLKLADALFRAGKDFDFLPLPGFTHMVPDPLVTRRLYTRILGFLAAGLAPGAEGAAVPGSATAH